MRQEERMEHSKKSFISYHLCKFLSFFITLLLYSRNVDGAKSKRQINSVQWNSVINPSCGWNNLNKSIINQQHPTANYPSRFLPAPSVAPASASPGQLCPPLFFNYDFSSNARISLPDANCLWGFPPTCGPLCYQHFKHWNTTADWVTLVEFGIDDADKGVILFF